MKSDIVIIGPCINMGGIERASSTIANQLSEEGHNVVYLAIFKHPKFFKLSDNVIYDEPTDGTNIGKLHVWKTIWRIRKQIKSYKPDTILAYNKFYASLALIALTGMRQKIYISERSSPLYNWALKVRIFYKLALLINPPTGVLAQTAIAAEYQRRNLGKGIKLEVIPNAIRKVTLYPEIQRKKQILAVGRLGDRLKGFDQLVIAFSRARKEGWELVFAGGNESGEYLQDLVQELGINNQVRFLGKVSNIDKVYAEAGIFVIPSRSEGFPNALCEAMAAGLPCIAFDFVAGPRDIITDTVDGIIVPDRDIDAMAEEISNLIDDSQKRDNLGNNARRIVDRFDEKIIGKRVLNFILS